MESLIVLGWNTQELAAYFDFYNERRRHQGLKNRTPDEVYWSTLRKEQEAA